jgi:hypothetical protein
VLDAIEGRLRDVTLTPEGRPVTVARLDEALAAVPGIVSYQLEQQAAARYVLRVLPDGAEPTDRIGRLAREALDALYGSRATLAVEFPGRLPQEPSGKYRLARGPAGFDPDTLLAT